MLYDVARRTEQIYRDVYDPALRVLAGSGHSFRAGRSTFQKQDLERLSGELEGLNFNDAGLARWTSFATSGAFAFIPPAQRKPFQDHLVRWWRQEISV